MEQLKKKNKLFKHSTTYYRKAALCLQQLKANPNKRVSNADVSKPNSVLYKLVPASSSSASNLPRIYFPEEDINISANNEETTELEDNSEMGQQNCALETNIISSKTEFQHDNDSQFVENLRKWMLRHKITHTASNELLQLLTSYGVKYLPKNIKTLLKTPREVSISPMGTKGEYWHNGLKYCLENVLVQVDKLPEFVSLIFNMDGLPVFRSSKCEIWPILCLVENIPDNQPMIIGVYCGQTKPENCELFLTPFVNELKILIETGIKIADQQINIKIKCFVCDTPARSFVKGTVSSNHYHGCTKCVVIGEYYNEGRHMSFPRIHSPLRTDAFFRERRDCDHHKETSPLEQLPIDFIKDFPVADSLHLIDLGITKRCLVGWTFGSFNFRSKWSARQMEEISALLENYNQFKPRELHRAIRKLDCLRFWKGLEFRTFLLYVGPVILKEFLPLDIYSHFLNLSCAITICSCKTYLPFINVAEQLLNDYIENFINLYGIDSISSNVHNLCHLVEDVKNLGYLPSISAYPFESFLCKIKNLLRTGNRPLAQVAKRLSEVAFVNFSNKPNNWPFVKNEFLDKNHDLPMCDGIFYELHLKDGLTFSNANKDKWFMTTKNEIVSMINATYVGKKLFIFGKDIKSKYCFFDRPFQSSRINIFESTGETNPPKLYCITEIKCKLFAIPHYDKTVFMPLLHSVDLLN